MANERMPVDETQPVRGPLTGMCAYVASSAMPWTEVKPGVHAKTLYCSEATGARALLFRLDAGAVSAPHAHEALEQIFVLDGAFFDGERYLRAGDACVRAPGTVHSAHSENGALALVVYSGPGT